MNRPHGFTMVELTLAMAIMSLAFLVLTGGILDLYHRYQSGLAVRGTQQNAREIADQLTGDVRSSAYVTYNSSANALCLFSSSPYPPDSATTSAGIMYYLSPVTGVARDNHLIRQPFGSLDLTSPNSCDPTTIIHTGFQIVSAQNTSVLTFSDNNTDHELPTVDLVVAATSDLSDLQSSSPYCPGGPGSQFCSVTELSITAQAARAQ